MPKMLVACEFSAVVRVAFEKHGWDAWSCDIIDSEIPGNHIKDDVLNVLHMGWDLMIAHPPCTHLCVSGARHFGKKLKQQIEALRFVHTLLNAPIPKIALENPVGVISTFIRKPTQIIQPWQFGHGECKATCLWLKNLPKLIPTNVVKDRKCSIHRMPPSRDRARKRSRTFQGIADAMADQWGNLCQTE